ncbi:hypothetical protein D1BOALGB6SA_217 [Olavius sp. associated proteobacterium Delta 1]|nr:hypothetical protein D1BOALGB6SA_217 [Olavius sp. associated proteobacterium Delta 1]
MYHFGYGSNLQLDFLKTLLPSAEFVMKGYLLNHEVQFSFWSQKKQGGISNAMPAPGKMVHGALYEVPPKEMEILDDMDGVYKGDYQRKSFLILGEDGKIHPADLYQVIDPQGPFPPSMTYVEGMLTGARQVGLDPEYIKTIENFYEGSQ